MSPDIFFGHNTDFSVWAKLLLFAHKRGLSEQLQLKITVIMCNQLCLMSLLIIVVYKKWPKKNILWTQILWANPHFKKLHVQPFWPKKMSLMANWLSKYQQIHFPLTACSGSCCSSIAWDFNYSNVKDYMT